MFLDTNIDEVIETMVTVNHGNSDARTQHMFRQSLYSLVHLAKTQQMVELQRDQLQIANVLHSEVQ
jgi:hypothetical protein